MTVARSIVVLAFLCLVACSHKASPPGEPPKPETSTQNRAPAPQSQPSNDAVVATPFGEVKVSDFYAHFNGMFVSTTKVYSTPNSQDGHLQTIDGPVYLMEKGADPQWIHVATEDARTFWIHTNEVDPQDYYHGIGSTAQKNETDYVQSLRREMSIIGKGNDWKRQGPVLSDESPGGRTFADGLQIKGPWYSLHAVYPRQLSLIRVQYYEGQSFTLIDGANGSATDGLLSEPYFSPRGELFVTCGSFFGDQNTRIGTYERGPSGFNHKQDLVISEGEFYSVFGVKWTSETTVDITLLDGAGRTPDALLTRDEQGTWHLTIKE